MTYKVQTHRNHCGWVTLHSLRSLSKATAKCDAWFKRYKAKKGTPRLVRVVDESGTRVYPPKKTPGS